MFRSTPHNSLEYCMIRVLSESYPDFVNATQLVTRMRVHTDVDIGYNVQDHISGVELSIRLRLQNAGILVTEAGQCYLYT